MAGSDYLATDFQNGGKEVAKDLEYGGKNNQ
jgi:hypothetical protein